MTADRERPVLARRRRPDNLDTLVTANYLLKAQDLQQAEQAAEAAAEATQTDETPPE